jgi:hypothetical protein
MLTAALLAIARSAAALPGDAADPISIKMALGTDAVTIRGVLSQKTACCAYTFKAHAGQQLHISESGAVVRMTLTAPDGTAIDVVDPTPLPQSGAYTLSVSPNQAAEGAFGRFKLKLRIPPAAP